MVLLLFSVLNSNIKTIKNLTIVTFVGGFLGYELTSRRFEG